MTAPIDAGPHDDPHRPPEVHQGDESREIEEEGQFGSSPAGLDANAALRALSRAARSFLIYDPHNEAIRHFLEDFRDSMTAALTYGTLELDIRPFELVRHGEVVYLDRDRERSLAFRMFRDGVRRLVISPDAAWEEQLKLLQILSIRYTGVRQQEDDIVTLLWKAGFTNIEVVAVEGFVPDEDDDEKDAGERPPEQRDGGGGDDDMRRAVARIEVPPDWDLPIEPPGDPQPLVYREVSDDALERLRGETSSHHLPGNAVRLIMEMLALVRDRTDPTQLAEVLPLVDEVRTFLLAEGQVARLLGLVRELSSMIDMDRPAMEEMLSRFADTNALRRVLHSVSGTAQTVPEELVELLALVPGDHLASLVAVLAVERATASRRIARQLIERYVATRIEYLEQQITMASPEVVADLLRAVRGMSPDIAIRLASGVIDHSDPDVQLQLIRILENIEIGAVPAAVLANLLVCTNEKVRARLIEMIVSEGAESSFDLLLYHLENSSAAKAHRPELIETARGLARIDPERAWQVFEPWVRPKRLLERVLKMSVLPSHQQWAGVAGLGLVPGARSVEAIKWLAERAGAELYDHCVRTLVYRRRQGVSDD